jgi:two-component system response regulator YesN
MGSYRSNLRYRETASHEGIKGKEVSSLPSLWNERILVVDDFEPILRTVSDFFREERTVDIARNGKEALDKVINYYYDVIISDVQMPLMDGIEFYKRACKAVPGIGSHFLFYTGTLEHEHIRFFHKHCLRFLQKPSSCRELEQAVKELLEDNYFHA